MKLYAERGGSAQKQLHSATISWALRLGNLVGVVKSVRRCALPFLFSFFCFITINTLIINPISYQN